MVCVKKCCCLFLFAIILCYVWSWMNETYSRSTKDPEMYAAILVKSDGCPHCQTQLRILKTGGSQARERILILDDKRDAAKVAKIVGPIEAVPLWFNPLTKEKSTGTKSLEELKTMGVLV